MECEVCAVPSAHSFGCIGIQAHTNGDPLDCNCRLTEIPLFRKTIPIVGKGMSTNFLLHNRFVIEIRVDASILLPAGTSLAISSEAHAKKRRKEAGGSFTTWTKGSFDSWASSFHLLVATDVLRVWCGLEMVESKKTRRATRTYSARESPGSVDMHASKHIYALDIRCHAVHSVVDSSGVPVVTSRYTSWSSIRQRSFPDTNVRVRNSRTHPPSFQENFRTRRYPSVRLRSFRAPIFPRKSRRRRTDVVPFHLGIHRHAESILSRASAPRSIVDLSRTRLLALRERKGRFLTNAFRIRFRASSLDVPTLSDRTRIFNPPLLDRVPRGSS